MALTDVPMAKKYVEVLGRQIAYCEMGTGNPIIFQHGNPTSSYLWRNIMPHCRDLGRCIAVDLIGMGDSDKLPDDENDKYSFACHAKYFEGALEALSVTDSLTLVLHDWGSALGFHWAERHRKAVQAIAYMEAIVQPIESWNRWPEAGQAIFQAMRSPAGEEIVLQKNSFVERILPASVLRKLSDAEMAEYRRPFSAPGEARRPTLTWPRQILVAGEPAAVVDIVETYAKWLASTPIPKLFINADPGSILVDEMREFCRTWPNQTETTVRGLHFIQEDSPAEITAALRTFIKSSSSKQ